jgi:hypothetical protein
VRAQAQTDRRSRQQVDRRRNRRGGRRVRERRAKWQRVTLLFAGYVFYLATRSLPAAIRRAWHRHPS